MAVSTLVKVLLGILALVGIVCCILGGVFYQKFPDLAKAQISAALPLKIGTEAFDRWSTSAVPVYWKWYFFNITNPEEAQNNLSAAVLQEVGPFIFREQIDKKNVEFVENGNSVKYDDYRTYYVEEGDYDIDSEINHLNIIYGLSSNMIGEDKKRQLEKMVKEGRLSLLERHSIRELLFDGYDSYFVKKARQINSLLWVALMKYKDKFALYFKKNGTKANSYQIDTGIGNIRNIGQIQKFNNRNSIMLWQNPCRGLGGTDGTMFHPGIEKSEKLQVFSHEITSFAKLIYENEETIRGIRGYKFLIPKEKLKMSRPENNCFCNETKLCVDGIVMMPMLAATPYIVFSAPHFYNGDEKLYKEFGLKPTEDKHESYIIVEPNTGVTVKIAKRLQVNVQVKKKDLPFLDNAPEEGLIFPVGWVEESAEIDGKTAERFRNEVLNKLKLYPNLLLALIGLGIFLILISTIIFIYRAREHLKPQKRQPACGHRLQQPHLIKSTDSLNLAVRFNEYVEIKINPSHFTR